MDVIHRIWKARTCPNMSATGSRRRTGRLVRHPLPRGGLQRAACLFATLLLACGAPARVQAAPREMVSLGGGVHLWSPGFCGGRADVSKEVDYFYDQGMRLFRIGLPWEVSQPALFGPLNEDYMTIIDADIAHILAKADTHVILELHAYMHRSLGATYHDGSGVYILPCTQGGTLTRVGDPGVPVHVTADLWTRLATRYPDPRIVYGLMNEPEDVSERVIFSELKEAMLAIRRLGRSNTLAVTVESNGNLCNYGGLCSGRTDIQALVALDPLHATIADVHNYFDNGSGQSATCERGKGARQAAATLAWVDLYDINFVTGEFGAGANAACREEVLAYLTRTRADRHDRGWTWYVGGVNDAYIYQLLPSALNANMQAVGPFQAKPQMEWLRPFLP